MDVEYVTFDPARDYPTDADLFYECDRCHSRLPSMPAENLWCDCYNVCIDVDAGRLAVKDATLVKLLRIVGGAKTGTS